MTRGEMKVRSASNQPREETCSPNIEIPTVKRDDEIDGTVGGPFLDLANVGGQPRLVHSAMEDLAPGRHGGTVKRVSMNDDGNWRRAKGEGALDRESGSIDSRD